MCGKSSYPTEGIITEGDMDVRFKGVRDTHNLAKQLDNIIIRGLKLYVNIPRYNRERLGQRTPGNKSQDKDDNTQHEVDCCKKKKYTNQGSYAEVLRRNIGPKGSRQPYHSHPQAHHTTTSSIHLNIEPEDTNWLKDAWVRRLSNPAMFDRVEEELLWETGLDISPKYIGDDLILLLGLTDNGAKHLMNGGQHGGTSMFYSMEKWNPGIRTGFRLTWVQVWGIPLQAWDTKYFRHTLAAMGDLVEIDDDTKEKRRLDRARVLLKTPWRPTINHMVEVHISDECFKVFVVEETRGGSFHYQRRRSSMGGSSDDISSKDISLGSLTLRTTSPRGLEDVTRLSPAQVGGDADSDGGGIAEVEEAHREPLLPSGSHDGSYPLGNASTPRATDQVTSQSATRALTASSAHDTPPNHGLAQCTEGVGVAGSGVKLHKKGKSDEGDSTGAVDALKKKPKASADMAATSNVADETELGSTNLKVETAQVQHLCLWISTPLM